jgi:hypothetical protein
MELKTASQFNKLIFTSPLVAPQPEEGQKSRRGERDRCVLFSANSIPERAGRFPQAKKCVHMKNQVIMNIHQYFTKLLTSFLFYWRTVYMNCNLIGSTLYFRQDLPASLHFRQGKLPNVRNGGELWTRNV